MKSKKKRLDDKDAFGYFNKMERDGNVYFPMGMPRRNDPIASVIYYLDEDGYYFIIAYTKNQIDYELRTWGMHSPYIPLGLCSSIGDVDVIRYSRPSIE